MFPRKPQPNLRIPSIIAVAIFIWTNVFFPQTALTSQPPEFPEPRSRLPELTLQSEFTSQDTDTIPLNVSETKEIISKRHNQEIPGWLRSIVGTYGKIKEIHVPNTDTTTPFVIHIQDIHQHYEAQKNIAYIIRNIAAYRYRHHLLNNDTRTSGDNPLTPAVIGLEGASGNFDFSPYRTYSDKELTKNIADYFMKKGTIGGPEFYGITAHEDLTLPMTGVENPKLYSANVESFKSSLGLAKEANEAIVKARMTLRHRKDRTLNPGCLAFDRKREEYQEGKISLGQYIGFLGKLNRSALPVNSAMFLKVHNLEKSLDFAAVEKERSGIMELMSKNLPKTKTDELIQLGLAYRKGSISFAEFYARFWRVAQNCGINMNEYPNLNKYVEYVTLVDKIVKTKLYAEIKDMETSLGNMLARTENEKTLLESSHYLNLVKKLVNRTLTAEEWQEYKESKVNDTITPLSLESYEAFYEIAQQRNEALVSNLLKSLPQVSNDQATTSMPPIAVLIAGGFHTQGVSQLLKEKNIPFVAVTPDITKAGSGRTALEMLVREKTPLEKLFAGEKISLASPLLVGAPRQTPVKNQSDMATRVARQAVDTTFAMTHIIGTALTQENTDSVTRVIEETQFTSFTIKNNPQLSSYKEGKVNVVKMDIELSRPDGEGSKVTVTGIEIDPSEAEHIKNSPQYRAMAEESKEVISLPLDNGKIIEIRVKSDNNNLSDSVNAVVKQIQDTIKAGRPIAENVVTTAASTLIPTQQKNKLGLTPVKAAIIAGGMVLGAIAQPTPPIAQQGLTASFDTATNNGTSRFEVVVAKTPEEKRAAHQFVQKKYQNDTSIKIDEQDMDTEKGTYLIARDNKGNIVATLRIVSDVPVRTGETGKLPLVEELENASHTSDNKARGILVNFQTQRQNTQTQGMITAEITRLASDSNNPRALPALFASMLAIMKDKNVGYIVMSGEEGAPSSRIVERLDWNLLGKYTDTRNPDKQSVAYGISFEGLIENLNDQRSTLLKTYAPSFVTEKSGRSFFGKVEFEPVIQALFTLGTTGTTKGKIVSEFAAAFKNVLTKMGMEESAAKGITTKLVQKWLNTEGGQKQKDAADTFKSFLLPFMGINEMAKAVSSIVFKEKGIETSTISLNDVLKNPELSKTITPEIATAAEKIVSQINTVLHLQNDNALKTSDIQVIQGKLQGNKNIDTESFMAITTDLNGRLKVMVHADTLQKHAKNIENFLVAAINHEVLEFNGFSHAEVVNAGFTLEETKGKSPAQITAMAKNFAERNGVQLTVQKGAETQIRSAIKTELVKEIKTKAEKEGLNAEELIPKIEGNLTAAFDELRGQVSDRYDNLLSTLSLLDWTESIRNNTQNGYHNMPLTSENISFDNLQNTFAQQQVVDLMAGYQRLSQAVNMMESIANTRLAKAEAEGMLPVIQNSLEVFANKLFEAYNVLSGSKDISSKPGLDLKTMQRAVKELVGLFKANSNGPKAGDIKTALKHSMARTRYLANNKPQAIQNVMDKEESKPGSITANVFVGNSSVTGNSMSDKMVGILAQQLIKINNRINNKENVGLVIPLIANNVNMDNSEKKTYAENIKQAITIKLKDHGLSEDNIKQVFAQTHFGELVIARNDLLGGMHEGIKQDIDPAIMIDLAVALDLVQNWMTETNLVADKASASVNVFTDRINQIKDDWTEEVARSLNLFLVLNETEVMPVPRIEDIMKKENLTDNQA